MSTFTNHWLTLLGVAALAAAAGCDAEMGGSGGEAHELTGAQAPTFELEQLGGGEMALADHAGEDIVVLDFWATWCGPCVRAMPMVQSVAEQYADEGVVVYAVNLRESDEEAEQFMEEHDLSLPVLMDRTGSIAELYKANAIPQTVIIDRDGTVSAVHVGFSPDLEQALSADIDALLGGGGS